MSFDNESYQNNSGAEASELENGKSKYSSLQRHGPNIQIIDQVKQQQQV